MDLEEIASYWARFHISFSWDYPEGLDLQAVQQAVFHVVGESDARLVHSKFLSLLNGLLTYRLLRRIITLFKLPMIYVSLLFRISFMTQSLPSLPSTFVLCSTNVYINCLYLFVILFLVYENYLTIFLNLDSSVGEQNALYFSRRKKKELEIFESR